MSIGQCTSPACGRCHLDPDLVEAFALGWEEAADVESGGLGGRGFDLGVSHETAPDSATAGDVLSGRPTPPQRQKLHLEGRQWISYYHGQTSYRRTIYPYSAAEELGVDDGD